MAYFHCEIHTETRNTSNIFKTHNRINYINREKPAEKAHDRIYSATLNLPPWAKSAKKFFDAAEINERKNAKIFTQAIISLPCELTHKQNIELANTIAKIFCGTNKVGCYAIHSKPAKFIEDIEQIHMHLIFSERIITDPPEKVKPRNIFFLRFNKKNPELGGYPKDTSLCGSKGKVRETLKAYRQKVAEKINEAYEDAGLKIRISEKSLRVQAEEARIAGNIDLAEKLSKRINRTISFKSFMQLMQVVNRNPIVTNDNIGIPNLNEELFNEKFAELTAKTLKRLHGSDKEKYLDYAKDISMRFKAFLINNINKQRSLMIENGKLRANFESYMISQEPNNVVEAQQIILTKRKQLLQQQERLQAYNNLYYNIYKDRQSVNAITTMTTIPKIYKKSIQLRKSIKALTEKIEKGKKDFSCSWSTVHADEATLRKLQQEKKEVEEHGIEIISTPRVKKRYETTLNILIKKYPARKLQYELNRRKIQYIYKTTKIIDSLLKELLKAKELTEDFKILMAKLKVAQEPEKILDISEKIESEIKQMLNSSYEKQATETFSTWF